MKKNNDLRFKKLLKVLNSFDNKSLLVLLRIIEKILNERNFNYEEN